MYLDQTPVQHVINGAPIFDQGIQSGGSSGVVVTVLGTNITVSVNAGIASYSNYMYVQDASAGDVHIFDTSASTLNLVTAFSANSDFEGVAVVGSYMYVVAAVGSRRFLIYDLANPLAPSLKSSTATAGWGEGLAVDPSGTYAFFSDYNNNNLLSYNVSNKVTPSLVSTVGTSSGPCTVRYSSGGFVTVVSQTGFIQKFTISSGVPTLSGTLNLYGNCFDHVLDGNIAYILGDTNYSNGYIYIVDVSGVIPTLVGAFQSTTGGNVNGHALYFRDNLLYITGANSSLTIVDMSNLSAPNIIYTSPNPSTSTAMLVVDSLGHIGVFNSSSQNYLYSAGLSTTITASIGVAGDIHGTSLWADSSIYIGTGVNITPTDYAVSIMDIASPDPVHSGSIYLKGYGGKDINIGGNSGTIWLGQYGGSTSFVAFDANSIGTGSPVFSLSNGYYYAAVSALNGDGSASFANAYTQLTATGGATFSDTSGQSYAYLNGGGGYAGAFGYSSYPYYATTYLGYFGTAVSSTCQDSNTGMGFTGNLCDVTYQAAGFFNNSIGTTVYICQGSAGLSASGTTSLDGGLIYTDGSGNVTISGNLTSKNLKIPYTLQLAGDLRGAYVNDAHVLLLNMELAATTYPSGITITSIVVKSSLASPTTQLAGTIRYCDGQGTSGAFPGANPVTIATINTTAGYFSSGALTTSVAAGKIIYLEMTADPIDFNAFWTIVITYTVN